MNQTNYGKFVRLDPIISQLPSLVELERIWVTLAFLKRKEQIVNIREKPVLLGKSEQETMVNEWLLLTYYK